MQTQVLANNGSNSQNAGIASANKTSVSTPSVVSAMSRYNQQIEDLYSSLVIGALENMESSEKRGQFEFVVFGSEKQDDLETLKKIKLSDIKKTNPDIANKILQFAKDSQAKRKGTDYDFSIKEDNNGDIEVPYIAIIDIVEKAVDGLPKDKTATLLQNVKDSLSQTKAEEEERSKRNGWISFIAGLITSAMTAGGLIIPNVISDISPSLAQGLKIMGFVGLGLTASLVLFGIVRQFMRAMKKNSIDTQKNTINDLLNNAKTKVDEMKKEHNQELATATANIATTTAGKAVGSALSHLQQAQQANNKQEKNASTESDNINTHQKSNVSNNVGSILQTSQNVSSSNNQTAGQSYKPHGNGLLKRDDRPINRERSVGENNNNDIVKQKDNMSHEEQKYNNATAQLKQEEEKLLKLFNKNYDNNKKSNGNLQSNDINNGEENTIIKGEQKNIVANGQNNVNENKKTVPQQKSGLDFFKMLMQMSQANKANVNKQTEPNKNINSNVANHNINSAIAEKFIPAVNISNGGENVAQNKNVDQFKNTDVVSNNEKNSIIVSKEDVEDNNIDGVFFSDEEENEEENVSNNVEQNIAQNKNNNAGTRLQGKDALIAFINTKEAKEANLAHKEKNEVNNVSHNAMSPEEEYNKGQKKILNSVNQNLIGVSTNTANGIK